MKVTTTSRLLEQRRAEEQDPIHLDLVTKYKCTSTTCPSSTQGLWCFPIKGTQQHYPIDGNIIRLWADAIKAGETTILNPPLEVWSFINKWLGLNRRGKKNPTNPEVNTGPSDATSGVQQHVSIVNQFTDPYRLEYGTKRSVNQTPSPQRLTLFPSPVPPLDRLASYIRWHVS